MLGSARSVVYLKCALVGIASGTVLVILWIVARLFLTLLGIWSKDEGGLGAASVGSRSILIVWLIGFAAGFWLMFRR